MKLRLLRLFAFALISGALVLTACATLNGKPVVVISAPPSGSTFNEGDDVAIQSTSGDATGVVRIELDIDGAVVRNDTPPSPQTNFSIVQTWKATQGSHTVTVRAYNAAGVSSDPAAISIQVNLSTALNNPSPTPTGASAAPSPTATNTPEGAPPSAPSPSPTTSAPVPCTNNSAFVTDVSVPDGTVFAAGTTFLKTWRLRNTGTCTWGAGYQLVFISGEAMTGSTIVGAPATSPGATADVSVSMTAPATPGNHTGTWRMRSAGGAVFGQSVTAKISVPGAPPPAPPAGCTGTPNIASFTASTNPITAGSSTTLNWGAVTGADSVEIDQGIGGVPAPGSTSVSPASTTTYTMTAHCGSNTTTAQVTVTVNPALPPPVAVIYDFVANANAAGWRNNDGTNLAFPGGTGNNVGFALWVNSPSSKMEDGSTPSKCLETHPKWVTGGTIYGTFNNLPPSYVVQSSDHFHATFGFLYGAHASSSDADVTFKVWMRHPSPPNSSQSFHKTYTGSLGSIDWSLAPWAGQTADFILEVDANNANASRDWACWTSAIITR